MSRQDVEKSLREVAKLPHNKKCFVCDAYTSYVVIPQNTFVCQTCSGIQ